MQYTFRKANLAEQTRIWEIIAQAILKRKNEGSNQWQDGYPNPSVIRQDIEKEIGFVLTEGDNIIGYAAVLINDEPAYDNIEGKWLTNGDYVVVHRIAIAEEHLGKGLAKRIMKFIEEYALEKNINSIKVDTNFDNTGMLKVLEKLDYTYCGEVFFRGAPRKAYEKVLK